MLVGQVTACENMKESKKLLKLTVFDGERERTILSGIAKWYKPEDLAGKKVGIVANLAPVSYTHLLIVVNGTGYKNTSPGQLTAATA